MMKCDILCAAIREAFEGVSLGNGIGLLEAHGLDSSKDEESCRLLRKQDEKEKWQRISVDVLNRSLGLSFLDAEGTRFHLPAFLIAELEGNYNVDLFPQLIHLDDHMKQKFSGLTACQKSVVGDYLKFIQEEPGYWLHVHDIELALESFWDPIPNPSTPT